MLEFDLGFFKPFLKFSCTCIEWLLEQKRRAAIINSVPVKPILATDRALAIILLQLKASLDSISYFTKGKMN
jgi:hypothetical protein